VARRCVEPDERSLEVLVKPPVHVLTGAGLAHLGLEETADERDLLHRRPHDPGTDLGVLGRQPVLPHSGRLDDVVVDRDDPRELAHG